MTSITSSASVYPGAVPASPIEEAGVAPSLDRFRIGVGSKAVRMGLGVAIAAVLAGDVYAILRSPVSEGRSGAAGAGAGAVSRATAAPAAAAFADPSAFGRAIDAALSSAGRTSLVTSGVAALGAPKPAVAAPALPVAPAAGFVTVTLPDPASTSATPSFTSSPSDVPSGPPPGPSTPPAESGGSPLAPVLEVVESVPVVGAPVAEAVSAVVEAVPVPGDSSEPSSAEPVAAVVAPVTAPSGLPL